MKICAESPSNREYSLCGNAYDAPDDPMLEDMEAFKFADEGETVTCEECTRVIRHIRLDYTQRYRRRKQY